MGASIVDRKNSCAGVKNGHGVIVDNGSNAFFVFELSERCGGNPAGYGFDCCGHGGSPYAPKFPSASELFVDK
jgi:hypothetical protein